MEDADVHVDPAEMELDDLSREYLESDEADITTRKNVEIFTEFSNAARGQAQAHRRCGSFARRSRSRATARSSAWSSRANELYRDDSGAIRARGHGERETIECGLVLRSIGYARRGPGGGPVRRTPRP